MPQASAIRFHHFMYLLWALVVFSVFMILFLPFCVIPLLISHSAGRISFFFFRLWSSIFSGLTGIQYHIEGRDRIDRHRAYIFTCNHTSYLDAPGVALAIPMQFRPLGKKELLKIPVFGFIVRAAAVVVDRVDTESRRKSVERLKRLLNLGISVLIFPEGTQNRSNKPLQPFYDGAFRLAHETQTAILPIVILGAGKLMPPGHLFIQPGRILVVVGTEVMPNQAAGGEEIENLKRKTFDQMQDIIRSHLAQSGT